MKQFLITSVLTLINLSVICLVTAEQSTITHSLDLEAELNKLFERKYVEIGRILEDKEKEFEKRERIYEEREEKLAERERIYEKREEKLAERERIYEEREEKLAERERIYEEREEKLAEREHNLEVRAKVLGEVLINKSRNDGDMNKRYVSQVSAPIGFTACVSVTDLRNLGGRQTIVFDRVITNMGSGYHPNLGVFVAPLKGLYIFHVSGMSSPGHSEYLIFVRNGADVSSIFPDSGDASTYHTASATWILELDVNAEVYLQSGQPGEIHGKCFTSFSGFLLRELQ